MKSSSVRLGTSLLALLLLLAIGGTPVGAQVRTSNLALASQTDPRSVGFLTLFTVSENDQDNRDLNGDGDALDQVVHIRDGATGSIHNLRFASDLGPRRGERAPDRRRSDGLQRVGECAGDQQPQRGWGRSGSGGSRPRRGLGDHDQPGSGVVSPRTHSIWRADRR